MQSDLNLGLAHTLCCISRCLKVYLDADSVPAARCDVLINCTVFHLRQVFKQAVLSFNGDEKVIPRNYADLKNLNTVLNEHMGLD